MDQERCFVNPEEDQEQYIEENKNIVQENLTHRILEFDDPEFEDTNINPPLNYFTSAESQILVATPNMLQTIKEVAEELLASSFIPWRKDRGWKAYSQSQLKAREKLMKLGLDQNQINKLLEFEVKKQASNIEGGNKKEGSRNLVYEVTKKLRRPKHHHHIERSHAHI